MFDYRIKTNMVDSKHNNSSNKDEKILETVNNRIYFYSEIERSYILSLNKKLREISNNAIANKIIEEVDKPIPIYLHINSYGGTIHAGFSGMDEIIKTNKLVDVITIVDGCCASAGTFLSIVGKKRCINRHAYMLIHQISSCVWGKYDEFVDDMENQKKLMKAIKNVYLEYTKIPEDKLDEILKHDLWFDAKECLKYGLVDEII